MDTMVKIKLPLPLDVTQTLLRAVGAAYPSTRIDTESEDELVLLVSDEDRDDRGDADDRGDDIAVTAAERNAEAEALLRSFKDGSASVSAGEWFTRMMVGVALQAFEDTPAENYLETRVRSAELGAGFVVVVQKDEGKSPNELRREAEEDARTERARARRYAARLRELGVDPDTF